MFRIYSSGDPIGVQVGGAVKNVMAVATGVCDALDFGANARAALITRGLAEMTRLGVALGANPLTFLGMAGVGDLILTCTGELSRNRTLGKQIAAGVDPQEYLASKKSVAEGYYTAAAAYDLSSKMGVEMAITENVTTRTWSAPEAVKVLLARTYKEELHGSTIESSADWRAITEPKIRLIAVPGTRSEGVPVMFAQHAVCARCALPSARVGTKRRKSSVPA
jgi:glycerol-3-phosphate dehydrogenase (NAD(P)+)